MQEAQKQVSYLESERIRLEKEIGEMGEKLDLIASHVAAHTEARCPLCDQELTREALALIQSKYAKEKEEEADAVIVNGENLSHKRAEFEALSREKVELESGLNQEKTRLQSQEDLLKSKIKEIDEDNLKIAERRGALNDIEQRLARREFAAAEQQTLGAIENELTGSDITRRNGKQPRKNLRSCKITSAKKTASTRRCGSSAGKKRRRPKRSRKRNRSAKAWRKTTSKNSRYPPSLSTLLKRGRNWPRRKPN